MVFFVQDTNDYENADRKIELQVTELFEIHQEMNDDLDFLNNGSGSEEIRAPGFPSASPLNKSGQSDFKGTGVKRKKKKHKNSNEWRKQLNEKVAQVRVLDTPIKTFLRSNRSCHKNSNFKRVAKTCVDCAGLLSPKDERL